MATIKSYSDLEQSKKLAEILPLESADMEYMFLKEDNSKVSSIPFVKDDEEPEWPNDSAYDFIPCWSLAALLELLDYPQLSKDKLGGGKVGWMVSVYSDNCRYDSRWCDNSIDACYEMIIKLHELDLL